MRQNFARSNADRLLMEIPGRIERLEMDWRSARIAPFVRGRSLFRLLRILSLGARTDALPGRRLGMRHIINLHKMRRLQSVSSVEPLNTQGLPTALRFCPSAGVSPSPNRSGPHRFIPLGTGSQEKPRNMLFLSDSRQGPKKDCPQS